MFCFSWKEKDSEPRSAETTENLLIEEEVATTERDKSQKQAIKGFKELVTSSCYSYQMDSIGKSPWRDPW